MVTIILIAAAAALDLWLACRALDRRIEQAGPQSSGPEKGGP